MAKRLKITQEQLGLLKNVIQETNANVVLKSQINDFLEKDYEATGGVNKLGNEFFDMALIKKKIDGEIITPNALYKYISHKFNGLKKSELIDSIEGWYHNDFDKDTGMRKKN